MSDFAFSDLSHDLRRSALLPLSFLRAATMAEAPKNFINEIKHDIQQLVAEKPQCKSSEL